MLIDLKIMNDTLLVDFNGELDHHMAAEVRKKIDDFYIEKGLRNIIFDLGFLNFMDSAGIGLVMGRYKLVSEKKGRICLINVGSRVEKILNMSGVLKIVKIYKDLTEALDKIKKEC